MMTDLHGNSTMLCPTCVRQQADTDSFGRHILGTVTHVAAQRIASPDQRLTSLSAHPRRTMFEPGWRTRWIPVTSPVEPPARHLRTRLGYPHEVNSVQRGLRMETEFPSAEYVCYLFRGAHRSTRRQRGKRDVIPEATRFPGWRTQFLEQPI